MLDFTIDTVIIPATIDAPDAADFIAMTHVRNEVEAEKMGARDLAYQPAELLSKWQNPYSPITGLVARVDGEIVAHAHYEAPIEDGATDAWFELDVLSEFRGQGIGSALYARLLGLCEADGRAVLQCFVNHGRSEGQSQLQSPTGFGSVPLESAGTKFLLTHGFDLEQVARISRLALSTDQKTLAASLSDAKKAAGDEYRVIRWSGPTPAVWRADMAMMYQRMSTDAPSAGLESTEEAWDSARVGALDAVQEASGRHRVVTVAEHIPTGVLVGFTELFAPFAIENPAQQGDTLVVNEHRGHRLGLLLKLANLEYLAEKYPGHPSVMTFNAEENRPMLDVNDAIGFVAVGYGGAWKKVTHS